MSEKALIFGPFLNGVEVINLDGNNLELKTTDSHSPSLIDQYRGYIAKKTAEYFGKKLNFVLTITEKYRER